MKNWLIFCFCYLIMAYMVSCYGKDVSEMPECSVYTQPSEGKVYIISDVPEMKYMVVQDKAISHNDIEWENISDVITSSDTIYPKKDCIILFYREDTEGNRYTKTLSKIEFNYCKFIESAIANDDMEVLRQIFCLEDEYPLTISYGTKYIEENVGFGTLDVFIAQIKEALRVAHNIKKLRIDSISSYNTDCNILKKEYPCIKHIFVSIH